MKIAEVFRPPTKGASTGESLTINGHTVELQMDLYDARANYDLVWVDSDAFDRAFQRSESFYIGKDGSNGIGKRYAQFGEWIQQSPSMIVSSVSVDENGVVMFSNGRHRYSYLRDNGINPIPVAMDRESKQYANQYHLISALNEISVGGSREEFIEKYEWLFKNTAKSFSFKNNVDTFDIAHVENDDNHYFGMFVDDSLIALLIVDDYRTGKMQIQLSITKRNYRGIGCFKRLLHAAIKKFGEVLSDENQTPEASAAWKAIIANPGNLVLSVYDPSSEQYTALNSYTDVESNDLVISAKRDNLRLDEDDHPRNQWARLKKIDRDYVSLHYGTRTTYFNP